MRHAIRAQRLSRPTAHRDAMLHSLVKSLLIHGQIRTTYARAKEAQRAADRLVTWGKQGSVHARRQAFRVLQDRTLVKRLFGDVAPTFTDVRGGYTRVVHLATRRGDGAQLALLAFSRLPAVYAPETNGRKPRVKPSVPTAAGAGPAEAREETSSKEKPSPKGFLEGLRGLFKRGPQGDKGV